MRISSRLGDSRVDLRAVPKLRSPVARFRNYPKYLPPPLVPIGPIPPVVDTSASAPDVSVSTRSWWMSPVNPGRESIHSSSAGIGNHDPTGRWHSHRDIANSGNDHSTRTIDTYNKAVLSSSRMAIHIAHSKSSSEVAGNVDNYTADKSMGKIAKRPTKARSAGMSNHDPVAPYGDAYTVAHGLGKSISGVSNGNSIVANSNANVSGNGNWTPVDLRYIEILPLDERENSVVNTGSVSRLASYNVSRSRKDSNVEVSYDSRYTSIARAHM